MTTSEMLVTERIYEILQQYLGNDIVLSPESDLLNDLGMDSLEQIELGLKLEKDFGIKIPAREMRGCVTVEEVVQLAARIDSQKAAKSV
jgi:acyl carrier protein